MKTYRIVVKGASHCLEVDGIPVPNECGVELFLHRAGEGYTVSEVTTGAAISPYTVSDAMEAVRHAEEIMAHYPGEMQKRVNAMIQKNGYVTELPMLPDQNQELSL